MSWTEAEAAFAANFDRYEVRLPQRELATTIEAALADGNHLAAQAGCGVGKSFGAMVPAIDYALATGKPVVAATATKALMNQYVGDMETLKRVYREFRYALLKGRSSYICRANLKAAEQSQVDVDLTELHNELDSDPEHTGDMDRTVVELTDKDRVVLSMSADECPGKKDCPFGQTCFAEVAKEDAQSADVVITNHAMLATDAMLQKKAGIAMLPKDRSATVVDEAHEFNDYATNAMSVRMTEKGFGYLASEIGTFAQCDPYLVADVRSAAAVLFEVFETFLITEENGEKNRKDPARRLREKNVLAMEMEFRGLIGALGELSEALDEFSTWGDDKAQVRKRRLQRRLITAVDNLIDLATADFGDMVRWVEREDTKRGPVIMVKGAPLHVGNFLRTMVWDKAPAVLLSATLAYGDDFSLLRYQLGFDNTMREFDAGTPFDFTTQARLYIPGDVPNPKTDKRGWAQAMALHLSELIKASDGRALLLFSAWTSLNDTYEWLAPHIRALGHQVYRQNDMASQKLGAAFTADEHSVLFAVKSFYTGIDIQGRSLIFNSMDKLPFPVPTDIIFQARCEVIDERVQRLGLDKWREGAFNKLTVPTMALTLFQGFGRLIRHTDDQGLVAIFDSRLTSTGWGKSILKRLPKAPLLTELPDAVEYLERIAS